MRVTLSCVAGAVTLAFWSSVSLISAPPPETVLQCGNPASGPPMAFAVLGDGFTAEDQGVFLAASTDLLCDGAITRDSEFKKVASKFAVTTASVVSTTEGIPGTGETPTSALGLIYNGSREQCFFDVSADSLLSILDATSTIQHTRTVIIANIVNQNAGCTMGSGLTIVTRGGSWKTMAHELGHFVGLRDGTQILWNSSRHRR